MNTQKVKQLALYGVAMGAAKISVAGCYPLIPGVFGVLLLGKVNRALLLTFTMCGMIFFVPVQEIVKYGMIVLVTAVVIKLVELINGVCSTKMGAAVCATVSLVLTISGEVLEIRNRNHIVIGILESIFIVTFIMAVMPIVHMFLECKTIELDKKRRNVKIPENGERLKIYADSFNGLSKMFSQMSRQKESFAHEEVGKMQDEIVSRICISCNQCAICWEEKSSMYQIFYRLLHSIEKMGMPEKDVHRELEAYCPYANVIVEEAVGVFEKARLNLAWYNRLLENREVIAQQLDAMAYIMQDCSKEYTDISKEEKRMLLAVRYRLKERGIQTREEHLYEKANQRLTLEVKVSAKWGNCVAVKDIAKAVSQGMRKNMIPVKNSKTIIGKEETVLNFEEEPKYQALYGVARISKDGAQISGDNFSFLDLDGGQSIVTLSDGMGSGIRACKESEMVIELIEKFLEAGFQKEIAIRMMNSAMVIQGEDGMYSTVDMAAMDLYSGNCEFYKIGAAPAFIKRGEQVEMVTSGSFPAGIFQQIEIEKNTKTLENGDFVILISDGVMDYLHVPEPEQTLKEILEATQINNSGKLAKYVLERILLFTGGKVPDDMTVLVAGIWER